MPDLHLAKSILSAFQEEKTGQEIKVNLVK